MIYVLFPIYLLCLLGVSPIAVCSLYCSFAERLDNAPYLSVVSFNSTIRRVQSDKIAEISELLRLQIYRCIQFNSVFFSSVRIWSSMVVVINIHSLMH